MRIVLSLLFLAMSVVGKSQVYRSMSVGEVYEALRELNTLGSALYIAAHPDDENTRMIAYLENERHIRTAYLSMTRGDGGQNLIGTEKGPLLGIIRTQELLAARRIDGGEQFFTRANDFGYSKTAAETFNIWDRDKVLADVVWTIRKFRPDVIITRFPPEKYHYQTHGHHQASAILAEEAFDLAGDPNAFPEQLKYVEPWQPKRLYWNTSTWFYSRSEEKFDPTGKLKIDVGGYNSMLGLSYGEIAGMGRSQHKSQGFGAAETQGSIEEWLEFVKGTPADHDLFEGVDLNWTRVPDGELAGAILHKALETFDPLHPTEILPQLIAAKQAMQKPPANQWVEIKKQELDQLIVGVSGLYYEALAEKPYGIPGDSVQLTLNLVNRNGVYATVKSVKWTRFGSQDEVDSTLTTNQVTTFQKSIVLPRDVPYTIPYWLEKPQTSIGMYPVADQTKIGKPENDPALIANVTIDMDGAMVTLNVPVQYKEVDRVQGEVENPFVISPPVTLKMGEGVIVSTGGAKTVNVTVTAWKDNQKGEVTLDFPAGWKVDPEVATFDLEKLGSEANIAFTLTPGRNAQNGTVQAIASEGEQSYKRTKVVLDYTHIPRQVLFPPAEAQLVNIQLQGNDKTIGYLMGAGDEVANYLSQAGFNVQPITEANFGSTDFAQFDAILIGIRALNTENWLIPKWQQLLDYAKNGGNLIVQYQTTWGLLKEDFGPYPLTVSHDRVTEEDAEMKVINPQEPVLNVPNKLGPSDFEGWVQERGLYFCSEWDPQYRTVFRAHDQGEDDLQGMLLIGDYGKGSFIYTGLSFFRELPAGVPGAYRLLTNLINYEPTGN